MNKETEYEPSYFEAIFADNDVQYRYGFEVDDKNVCREWLYQKVNKRKAKEVELFLRTEDNYEIHTKFAVGKEVVEKKMVRDNALLLSVAAQFNESVSVDILAWLANTTIVTGSSDERIWEMATTQIDNSEMKQRIVAFAQFADFGIDDIRKVDDSFGASSLYSLAEYKVRNSAPFAKDYLMGKYGGVPVVGQFERLFNLRDEDENGTGE